MPAYSTRFGILTLVIQWCFRGSNYKTQRRQTTDEFLIFSFLRAWIRLLLLLGWYTKRSSSRSASWSIPRVKTPPVVPILNKQKPKSKNDSHWSKKVNSMVNTQTSVNKWGQHPLKVHASSSPPCPISPHKNCFAISTPFLLLHLRNTFFLEVVSTHTALPIINQIPWWSGGNNDGWFPNDFYNTIRATSVHTKCSSQLPFDPQFSTVAAHMQTHPLPFTLRVAIISFQSFKYIYKKKQTPTSVCLI